MFGDIFSIYNTVFISPNVTSVTPDFSKQFFNATAIRGSSYQAKILALAIITPPAVWSITYALNNLMQKLDLNKQNRLIKKTATLIKKCKESFVAKALISITIAILAETFFRKKAIGLSPAHCCRDYFVIMQKIHIEQELARATKF